MQLSRAAGMEHEHVHTKVWMRKQLLGAAGLQGKHDWTLGKIKKEKYGDGSNCCPVTD